MGRWNPFARSLASLSRLWKTDVGDYVNALAWAPDGKSLAAASAGGPIPIYESASGKKAHELAGHTLGTAALSWSQTGQYLASGGQDGKVRVWTVGGGVADASGSFDGGAAWVERVAWCPTADVLASAAGKKLRLWDPAGTLLREYPAHPSTIADIQWKPGETLLASAAYGQLALWRVDQAEPVRQFNWKGSMLALAWSPDGRYVATGDQDCTVHFWIVKTGEDLQMSGYPTKVRELSWDPTSRFLATGGGAVPCVWDCAGKGPAGTAPLQFEAHTDRLSALAFQHKGPVLASAGLDGLVAAWEPGKQQNALALVKLDAPVSQIAWSPNDRYLAVGTETGLLAVYAAR